MSSLLVGSSLLNFKVLSPSLRSQAILKQKQQLYVIRRWKSDLDFLRFKSSTIKSKRQNYFYEERNMGELPRREVHELFTKPPPIVF